MVLVQLRCHLANEYEIMVLLTINTFYRAMLCTAQRGLCCRKLSVSLSVYLSLTPQYSIEL